MSEDRDDLRSIAALLVDICVSTAKLNPGQTISVLGGAIGMAIAHSGVPEMNKAVWPHIKILARHEFEQTRQEIAEFEATTEIKH
jgi:hypothetical protein